MKKSAIIIMVLVFVVVAVVVYLVMSTNKSGQTVTKKTESTGLSNFFASGGDKLVGLIV